MTALSDGLIERKIRAGLIGMSPFDPKNIQPASYDLTLLSDVPVKLHPHNEYTGRAINGVIDAFIELIATLSANKNNEVKIEMFSDLVDKLEIVRDANSPHTSFQLLSTREIVTLPANIRAEVHGRSSLARKGLFVHVSAGFIDPGFSGQITLECINVSKETITLLPNDRVAQIAFTMMDDNAKVAYGEKGRYQHQRGPTESRFKHGHN